MGPHTLDLTAADYTPRLYRSATSETLGGAQRTLVFVRGASSGHPPSGCLEDEENEPQGIAKEARETGERGNNPPGGQSF